MKKDTRRNWDATRFDSDCNDDLRSFCILIALGNLPRPVLPDWLSKARASYVPHPQKSNLIFFLMTRAIDRSNSLLHHPRRFSSNAKPMILLMILMTAHSIRLRPAKAEDQAFLFDLYRRTRAEEMAAWGWNEAQQQSFLNLQFRGQQAHYAEYPNTAHKIILNGEHPIGRLFVSRLEDEIRLVDIALLPEHCGQGIGTALIQELIEEAARVGKAVRLHVEKFNRAQRLYQRLGFQVIGDIQSHYFMEWKTTTGEK